MASGINDGNKRQAYSCEYCWLVLYSKGALTRHMREEHWRELEAEESDDRQHS